MQLAALGQQFRSCCSVDGAIDATATEQRGVGGVDDGVDALFCDVALQGDEFCHGGCLSSNSFGFDDTPERSDG